jgi:ElaB/YqjD/DUF883 family membrane-anchored ribosome-binding protein
MNHSTVSQTPAELLDQLHALAAEAEKLLESASSQSDETMAALRERYESARERVGALYAEAKAKVATGAKNADAAIRANPYQSLAIALGTGLILGLLLGGRQRNSGRDGD